MVNIPKATSSPTHHLLALAIHPQREDIIHLHLVSQAMSRVAVPSNPLKFTPTTATSNPEPTRLQTLMPTLPLRAPTRTRQELVAPGGPTRM